MKITDVIQLYLDFGDIPVSNESLYQKINEKNSSINFNEKNEKNYNINKRKFRWFQQTLKHAGVIEKVQGNRGLWKLCKEKEKELTPIDDEFSLVGFSTDLGVAILGNCKTLFSRMNEKINLILLSPPYPLTASRNYGNVSEKVYVDWLCNTLEPVIVSLAPGGSLCINVSNDIFLSKMPARSLYRERLVLTLCDRFGLYKCDELIWNNPSKPPGPVQWASLQRQQLNVGWEPVYWFTNDPTQLASNNQRVLQPHSERQLRLIESGGIKKSSVCSDGAYIKRVGAYSNKTKGKIPKNVLTFGSASKELNAYRKHCLDNNLPVHGATMPIALAKFLIEFTTRENELVVDPMAGSFTTCLAAEQTHRRWIGTEKMLEYVQGARFRFSNAPGFAY